MRKKCAVCGKEFDIDYWRYKKRKGQGKGIVCSSACGREYKQRERDAYPYRYAWKNNEKRAEMYGRRFTIIARGARNSRLVEFENGQREIISGNAIRKAKEEA